jgi:short-subunit dehydrogenase
MPQATTTAMIPRTALVTGASAGIGASFARLLAEEGYNLILVARRRDRLQKLADELASKYSNRYEVLEVDLTDPSAPTRILSATNELGMPVDFLVNNAGFGAKEKFPEAPWPSLASEIQVMVTALTELSHLVLPQMKQQQWGRIVNVASIAAFMPPTAGFLYTGIKSYVVHMSESLDIEMKPYGIHVSALCPGFTRTEFHDVMQTQDAMNTKLPAFAWQQPDEVVREGYDAVMAGKPFFVTGRINRIIVSLMGRLPESWRYFMGSKNTLF